MTSPHNLTHSANPRRKAVTHLSCLKITKNTVDAFVLFWVQFQFRKAEKIYDGKRWFIETKEHIADCLDGITTKQVRTSFKRLIAADLIETVRKKSPYHGMSVNQNKWDC